MKFRNYLVTFLITVMLLIVNSQVEAATCDNTTMQNLKKLAKEVDIGYELVKQVDYADGHRYNITIDNLVKEVYVEYSYYKVNYSDTNNGSYTLEHVIMPRIRKAKISIYAASGPCKNQLLRAININFPYYNSFSEYAECQEYKEADICRKDKNTYDLTDDDFKKEIEKYKKKLEEQRENNKEEKKSIFIIIKNFILENKIVFGVGLTIVFIIIISTSIILFVRKKKRIKINLGDKL